MHASLGVKGHRVCHIRNFCSQYCWQVESEFWLARLPTLAQLYLCDKHIPGISFGTSDNIVANKHPVDV